MTVLRLTFTDTEFERPVLRDKFDLLLGVVATMQVVVGDRLLYREVMFPIVELRVALAQWLREGLPTGADFEFVSMESDEPGLVWFRRQAGGSWRAGSVHQEYPEIQSWTDAEVRNAVRRFTADVDDWVSAHLNVRVEEMISM
jgi:hypothetical protein